MPKLLDSFITWMCLRKVESSKVIGHRGKEACEQRRENKKNKINERLHQEFKTFSLKQSIRAQKINVKRDSLWIV